MAMNGSGVRDTGRILKIAPRTVTSEFKKTPHVNPYVLDLVEQERLNRLEIDFYYTAELDEFWSFVGNKGKRTDADFAVLLYYLSKIPIGLYCSDNWGSYSKYLSADKHYIGKDMTWKIERKNLNFRTHIKKLARKTICYSKDEQIHDNINRYVHRTVLFQNRYVFQNQLINGFET